MTQTFHYFYQKKVTGLKTLTHKQMLQKITNTSRQVKAGNNSENLLNEIMLIAYSLYQSKEVTKKNAKAKLCQYEYKIDTSFMNSDNCKTSKPHVLILNLSNKIRLTKR